MFSGLKKKKKKGTKGKKGKKEKKGQPVYWIPINNGL